jgi:GTP cyclohydrolase I
MTLRVVDDEPLADSAEIEQAVAALLTALGRDVTDERLADTPRRVAESMVELLTPPIVALTTFPNEDGYADLILVRDIPFVSLCEHHLLPFRGVAHVGYVPGDRIVGLSKLARVVELFARDLQVQERMTVQIARWLNTHLRARGVGVVIEAEHMCMSVRGIKTPGATTITSTFLGEVEQSESLRSRFPTPEGQRR